MCVSFVYSSHMLGLIAFDVFSQPRSFLFTPSPLQNTHYRTNVFWVIPSRSVCLEPVKWYSSSYPLLVCVKFLKGNAVTIHDINYFLISGPRSSSQYDNSLINTLHVLQDSTKPIERCLSERMPFMLFRCTNPITMAVIGREGWLMLFD